MVDGDALVERLEDKRKEVMDKYPFHHRIGAEKWIYLEAHGYTSDRLMPDCSAILFYKRGYPHIHGMIDWWGRVTWFSEEV